MNVRRIVLEYIDNHGNGGRAFNGLLNEKIGCGCGAGFLMNCDYDYSECVPAHRMMCVRCGNIYSALTMDVRCPECEEMDNAGKEGSADGQVT